MGVVMLVICLLLVMVAIAAVRFAETKRRELIAVTNLNEDLLVQNGMLSAENQDLRTSNENLRSSNHNHVSNLEMLLAETEGSL